MGRTEMGTEILTEGTIEAETQKVGSFITDSSGNCRKRSLADTEGQGGTRGITEKQNRN